MRPKRHFGFCPCGRPGVKRDHDGAVCASCLKIEEDQGRREALKREKEKRGGERAKPRKKAAALIEPVFDERNGNDN